ncbi:MAG: hypothetical protein FJ297_18630 [Planctomycetes bacterium]|nr:hypothetical protein [Planctomycetota bacterium]
MREGIKRRTFLKSALVVAGATLSRMPGAYAAEPSTGDWRVGEGVVNSTPPLGIELGGFHRAPGNERRIEGIRQATAVRALAMRHGDTSALVLSIDIAGTSGDVADRIRKRVGEAVSIPADHVRVCSTHTHSMPAFCYLRQWGAIPTDYLASVEGYAVEAAKLARADLAPAKLRIGKSRAIGASFNRTTNAYRTDDQFTADATDADRWLDTTLHLLHFERTGGKPSLLWYHFSAHPVCYADGLAGPDWPGLVHDRVRASHGIAPVYLQGHAGDVNPGAGDPWRGDAEKTAEAVHASIGRAMNGLRDVHVPELRIRSEPYGVDLDLERFQTWLRRYRDTPDQCAGGEWVDAGFAKDWYEGNSKQAREERVLSARISAFQVGEVGIVFHPSELYSYYGLAIRRASPMADTIVVGYTDGLIGYLTDPTAYSAGEYAALTVPKILDFPPFAPHAASRLADAVVDLMRRAAT